MGIGEYAIDAQNAKRTPDLPPTPQPGEVWENDDGERRFVMRSVEHEPVSPAIHWASFPQTTDFSTSRGWRDWAIRTNARVVLAAREKQ